MAAPMAAGRAGGVRSRPLRALFLTHSYPRASGDVAGSFVLRLAQALGTVGVEVRVLAPAAAGLPTREVLGGVGVRRFRYAPRGWQTLAYGGQMAELARASWRGGAALGGLVGAGSWAIRREVGRWRPDVVHAHWWFPGGLSAAVPGALAGRPLVLTMHGSDVRLARAVRPAHTLFARVARRAAVVTAVSRWLCAEASRMAADLACEVAPMPVDVDALGPWCDADASGREGLLFVGRLTRQKGVHRLLYALALTRSDVTLTVVGDGPEHGALIAQVGALGLVRRVTFVRAQPHREIGACYRRARAVVVPSTGEGLGLVAVEALWCGTPVVALASGGGLTDVVRDGETGLLVSGDGPADLADALDRVTRDPVLAARLGRAGRALVDHQYTPAASARTYRALYERAIATP